MNKLTAWIEKHMLPLAAKIGGNSYLVAMRDAFATIMPLIIVGSLGTLIANTVLKSNSLRGEFLNWGVNGDGEVIAGSLQESLDKFISPTFMQMWWAGLGILTLLFIIAFGYYLAKSKKTSGIIGATFSVAMFFVFVPQAVTLDIEGSAQGFWGMMSWANFNGGSLLAGLLITLIFTSLFIKLTSTKKFNINMGEFIPPAVADGFNAIVPAFLVIVLGGVVFTVVDVMKPVIDGVTMNSVIDLVNTAITAPIAALGQNIFAVIILLVLMNVFWFFGLHGANIFEPVVQAVYLPALSANAEAINQGVAATHVFTKSFLDSYVHLGGSGATLGLLIAIFLISKRKDYRQAAKIGIGPSIFMINEPTIFGVPIVLNPILLIPFLITPIVLAIIGYVATISGFAGYTYVMIPWTTPPVLGAFMSTGGSIGAAITALVCLIVSIVIYLPFVGVANKQSKRDMDLSA